MGERPEKPANNHATRAIYREFYISKYFLNKTFVFTNISLNFFFFFCKVITSNKFTTNICIYLKKCWNKSKAEQKCHNLKGFEVQRDSLRRDECRPGGVLFLQEIATERNCIVLRE